ncbi:TraX family protein [Tissierellaceae bacterium HCP3S3_D8]
MIKKETFTANQLKLIAIVAMLIDHIATTIIWRLYLDATIVDGVDMMGDLIPEKAKQLYFIYIIMRIIGRLAFPIFAFMIVEGFLHTTNLKRYMKRLFIFALISEIPYDIANSRKIISFYGQNVIWTLLIGLITLYFIKRFENHEKKVALTIIFVLLAEIITFLIQSDYNLGGVLLITIIYLFRNDPRRLIIGEIVALIIIALNFMWIQLFGLIAFILLRHYNGTIGKGNKYLFYVFYPIHLLILGVISINIFN